MQIITCPHGIKPKGNCRECTLKRYRNRAYTETQRQRARARTLEWQKTYPERVNKKSRKWRDTNPEQYTATSHNSRARRKHIPGTFTANEWAWLKRLYKFTCLACGRKEPEIELTPDHVKPFARGGTNYITNIQPLCLDCNNKKHTDEIDYRR